MSRWSTQQQFRVDKKKSPRNSPKRSRSKRTSLRLEFLEERQVPAPLLLNEVSVNEPGTDNPWEYMEIKGDASGTIAAGTYLVDFEGDGSGSGIADLVVNLSSLTLGTNGLLIVKSPTGGHTIPSATTVVTDAQLDTVGGGLENGTISFLLISSPTTAITELTDYDTNNDGALDALPGDASILDAIGWTDGSAGDRVYGGVVLTQTSGVTDAASRFKNVITPSTVSAWYNGDLVGALPSAVDYDAATGSANLPSGAIITPGAVNSHATAQLGTTTVVGSDFNPSVYGQSITLTATVSASSGTPTGTVQFFDGVTSLGTDTLDGAGQATLNVPVMSTGTHSLTATYLGDVDYTGSTSNPLSQIVNQSATNSGLATSVNPSSFSSSVTFTATVTPVAPGAGLPTGMVEFFDGVTSLGTDALDGSGVASVSTSALTPGSHSITASYLGDTNFATSTSSPLSQTVKVDTSTGVAVDVNPSVFGQAIVVTATVTGVPSGQGTPSGNVEFFDGVTSLGVFSLNGSGQASLGTSALAVGSHSITATYAGDSTFFGSTSSPLSQTVNKANTGTVLVSSANPSLPNQLVTFTATVTASAPGSGLPTGSVEFFDGVTSLGVFSLNGSGQASVSTSTLTIGFHTITASYLGDGNFNTSVSAPLIQGVKYAKSGVFAAAPPVPMPPAPPGPGVTPFARPDIATRYDFGDASWRWAWLAALAAADLESL